MPESDAPETASLVANIDSGHCLDVRDSAPKQHSIEATDVGEFTKFKEHSSRAQANQSDEPPQRVKLGSTH
jgi:hypothetical protein